MSKHEQEASKRQATKSTGMEIAHRASNSKKEQQSATQMSEQHGCRRGKALQHHAGRGKSGKKEARTDKTRADKGPTRDTR